MEILFAAAVLIQSMSISLGVGGSTLAILNFFAAIKDGVIDETERNLMGIVYLVLRIAMTLIFLTTLLIGLLVYSQAGLEGLSPYFYAQWTLIAVLYVNALLMTFHYMPSTLGPALQAATWYTLGMIVSLNSIDLAGFTYLEFVVGYLAAVALATAVVNGTMTYLKHIRTSAQPESS